MLRKYLRLTPARRLLVIRVAGLLLAARAGLFLLPYGKFRQIIDRLGRSRPGPADSAYVDEISWAINRSGKYLLGENACLPKALIGQMLLNRRGFQTRLRIGAIKDPLGKLTAHAWVEYEGRVIIGGDISNFSQFTALTGPDETGV